MNIGLKKVIADMLQFEARLKKGISSANKEIRKTQARLKNFELLARDAMYGKYYKGYVKSERATIERLQKYVTRCQSCLVKIGKDILALRQHC